MGDLGPLSPPKGGTNAIFLFLPVKSNLCGVENVCYKVSLLVTYTVHLWLVGKRVVDFLLVLIEISLPAITLRRYERILVKIVVFKRGLSANFSGKGVINQRLLASEN